MLKIVKSKLYLNIMKMRKSLFFIAVLLVSLATVNAQELTSKKGTPILPQAGDWAIGVDAAPFLDYVGNFIGGDGLNVSPTFDFLTTNQAFSAKYFVDNNKAYRLGLLLNLGTVTNTSKTPRLPVATPITYVDDKTTVSNTNVALSAGMEWRRGIGRLYGFYGAEAGLGLGSTTTKFEYGNPISTDNPVNQTLSVKSGLNFGLGLRAFAGVEYFILPKISIGGEFGWAVEMLASGEGEVIQDNWTGTGINTVTTNTGKTFVLGLQNDNNSTIFGPAGQLRLTFHF